MTDSRKIFDHFRNGKVVQPATALADSFDDSSVRLQRIERLNSVGV